METRKSAFRLFATRKKSTEQIIMSYFNTTDRSKRNTYLTVPKLDNILAFAQVTCAPGTTREQKIAILNNLSERLANEVINNFDEEGNRLPANETANPGRNRTLSFTSSYSGRSNRERATNRFQPYSNHSVIGNSVDAPRSQSIFDIWLEALPENFLERLSVVRRTETKVLKMFAQHILEITLTNSQVAYRVEESEIIKLVLGQHPDLDKYIVHCPNAGGRSEINNSEDLFYAMGSYHAYIAQVYPSILNQLLDYDRSFTGFRAGLTGLNPDMRKLITLDSKIRSFFEFSRSSSMTLAQNLCDSYRNELLLQSLNNKKQGTKGDGKYLKPKGALDNQFCRNFNMGRCLGKNCRRVHKCPICKDDNPFKDHSCNSGNLEGQELIAHLKTIR